MIIYKTNINKKYKKHAFVYKSIDAFSKEFKWTMKGEGVC